MWFWNKNRPTQKKCKSPETKFGIHKSLIYKKKYSPNNHCRKREMTFI